MTWILNTIVSASLRRVSLGISANVSGIAEGRDLQHKSNIDAGS